jgi:hypothetical protein
MSDVMANDEMVEGYRDGLRKGSPEPSSNRTRSYRHGFANGRADISRPYQPRADIPEGYTISAWAEECMRLDAMN